MYVLDYPVPPMHSAFHIHDTVLVGWYTLISTNIVLSAFRQHTFSIEVLLIRVWHYTSIGTHVPGQTNACKPLAKQFINEVQGGWKNTNLWGKKEGHGVRKQSKKILTHGKIHNCCCKGCIMCLRAWGHEDEGLLDRESCF